MVKRQNPTQTALVYAYNIGSGNKGKGFPIYINGGIVTAEGGDYSSGIGGGRYCRGGGVYIYGGTVKAKGGSPVCHGRTRRPCGRCGASRKEKGIFVTMRG